MLLGDAKKTCDKLLAKLKADYDEGEASGTVSAKPSGRTSNLENTNPNLLFFKSLSCSSFSI